MVAVEARDGDSSLLRFSEATGTNRGVAVSVEGMWLEAGASRIHDEAAAGMLRHVHPELLLTAYGSCLPLNQESW